MLSDRKQGQESRDGGRIIRAWPDTRRKMPNDANTNLVTRNYFNLFRLAFYIKVELDSPTTIGSSSFTHKHSSSLLVFTDIIEAIS